MDKKCTILWTNADPITAKFMVFMYAENALKFGWWEEVQIVVWGATAKLVADDKEIREKLLDIQEKGVQVSFCKACADELGVAAQLEDDFELIYWGVPLTEILKTDSKLLTI
jgi:hypothetical protein